MPYLRFSRDERGYEHTYVLHGLRSGSRPRLLYWFRTPPNVNVGRLPLDEDAIRAIEDSNAELTFDWGKMLRVKPPPAPVRPDEDGRRSRARSAARRERRAAPGPPGAGRAADDRRPRGPAGPDAGRAGRREALGAVAGPGGEPDSGGEPAPAHPVAALVGDDGLARLRAQYAELRARLTESRAEPRLRERVSARVEALNPDGWRPGEEAVLGIERFESEAAAVKADLGRRRRRAPRGRRGTEKAPPTGQD